jgi:hypothetical protein
VLRERAAVLCADAAEEMAGVRVDHRGRSCSTLAVPLWHGERSAA